MRDPLPDAATVRVRPASADDLPAVHRLYNDEVLGGVATWDIEPWSWERRVEWFAEHDENTPVLVAEQDRQVVGFAYLSIYRPKPGYGCTRENTIFVDPRFHRAGIGRLLLGALIEEARRIGMHTLVAWIESENVGSIELHRSLGYTVIGTERETGFKFGRWLNTVEVQLMLREPRDAGA